MSPWVEVPDVRTDAMAEVGPVAFAVYTRLLAHRNRKSGQTNPSVTTLAKSIGVNRKTILKGIESLESAGWIRVERSKSEGGRPAGNRYTFPPKSLVQKTDQAQSLVRETDQQPLPVGPLDGPIGPPDGPTVGPRTGLEPEEGRTRGRNQKKPSGWTIQNLVDAWNKIPDVSHCRAVTDNRKKSFRARSKDPGWIADLQAAVERVEASSFCRGQNDRGWKADIDWFLRPDTATKLLEGKYDNHNGKSSGNGRLKKPQICTPQGWVEQE